MNENNVTRLWTPDSMYTVQQALDEAEAEHVTYDLKSVIILGEYQEGGLMVKPSRTTHEQALWLIMRAQNHCTGRQFRWDDSQ